MNGVIRSLSAIYLLALLLGCSDETSSEGGASGGAGAGGSGGTGGSSAEDAGDDSSPTPTSWPVHVEVVGKPADAPPFAVLISRQDGSEESVTETDATGKVDVQVPHLGSVAVFQNVQGGGTLSGVTLRYAYSFNLVDEETTVRAPIGLVNAAGGPDVSSITFTADPTTLPAGTDKVRVELPCAGFMDSEGAPTNPIEFDTPALCFEASEYYAVALALDAEGKALGATVLEHLPATSGAKTHDLMFDGTTGFTNLEPSLAPVDPNLDDVSIKIGSIASGATYGKFPQVVSVAGLAHPVGNQKLVIPVVTSFFTEFQLNARIDHPEISGLDDPADIRGANTSTFPKSFDLDVASLAPIESSTIDGSTTIERPSVTFGLGEGELGNCIVAKTGWINGAEVTLWAWTTKAQSSGTFRVPELPASLSSFAPDGASLFANWTQGVSHVVQSAPCADLVVSDRQMRSAQGPTPE